MSGQQPPQQPPAGGTPPPAPPSNQPPDDDRFAQKVAAALGSLFSGGKAQVTDGASGPASSREEHRGDVAAQVRKAVDAIRAEDQSKAEQEQQATAVQMLRSDVDALTAATQKQPLQTRKVERWMGWHLPEERG